MAGDLSFLQEEALISLIRGWPWGIDARSSRGLAVRGLIVMRTHRINDPAFDTVREIDLPVLTEAGGEIARDLDRAQRRRAGQRPSRHPGLAIVDGGLSL